MELKSASILDKALLEISGAVWRGQGCDIDRGPLQR